MPTFALNFSRPGSEVIAQYYMFTTLGRERLRAPAASRADVATYISAGSRRSAPTA